jgi:hypothetical protein
MRRSSANGGRARWREREVRSASRGASPKSDAGSCATGRGSYSAVGASRALGRALDVDERGSFVNEGDSCATETKSLDHQTVCRGNERKNSGHETLCRDARRRSFDDETLCRASGRKSFGDGTLCLDSERKSFGRETPCLVNERKSFGRETPCLVRDRSSLVLGNIRGGPKIPAQAAVVPSESRDRSVGPIKGIM